VAQEWLREAMGWYEKAEKVRPAANDEAILRWNSCMRQLERHQAAGTDDDLEPTLGE
jgi:hypothetical protein